VTELIKIEDDVVVEYVYGMLEDKANPVSHKRRRRGEIERRWSRREITRDGLLRGRCDVSEH
jgi:hypothetical protein